jgi:hypothetical protein
MSFVEAVSTRFHPVTCCECSCTFAIDDTLNDRARVWKKRSVYCPSCGTCQGWGGETPDQKIRREMEAELVRVKRNNEYLEATAKWQEERAEAAERSLSATKGVVTRIKNRVSKGVCPCCNRTFVDLQRHMHTKHPEYASSVD